jgi:hypothetical protein
MVVVRSLLLLAPTPEPSSIPSAILPSVTPSPAASIVQVIVQDSGPNLAEWIEAFGAIGAVLVGAFTIYMAQRNFFQQLRRTVTDAEANRQAEEAARDQQRKHERELQGEQRLHDLEVMRDERQASEHRIRQQRELDILEKLYMSTASPAGHNLEITADETAWLSLLPPEDLPLWRDLLRIVGSGPTRVDQLLERYQVPGGGRSIERIRLAQRLDLIDAISKRTGNDANANRQWLAALYSRSQRSR